MALKDLTSWVCDLCGDGKTVKKSENPEGWVKISVEDSYEERCWHDKVVCPRCIELIDKVRKKMDKRCDWGSIRGTGPVHLSGMVQYVQH
jgi:hypothetical protein